MHVSHSVYALVVAALAVCCLFPLVAELDRTGSGRGGGGSAGGAGAGSGGGGGGGNNSFTKIKEKNRLAQQRFRQKQKNMVATLKTRLEELEEAVSYLDVTLVSVSLHHSVTCTHADPSLPCSNTH